MPLSRRAKPAHPNTSQRILSVSYTHLDVYKRQPLFFLLREPAGNSMAAMCMMLVMMPFFLLAMYEKHGQPLEKIISNILKVAVIRPKQRPYQTNNFYAVLKRQEMLDKEVYDIVHRNEKLAAPSAGKTGRKDRASGKEKENSKRL